MYLRKKKLEEKREIQLTRLLYIVYMHLLYYIYEKKYY